MTDPNTDLNALRTQIDAIDGELHKLLMQRFAITAEVARAKGAAGDPSLIPRPVRERDIIAQRLRHHSGPMPTTSLIRIWKEIMGAACHQQGDFKIGVAAEPFSALGLAARDHFGTAVHLLFGDAQALAADLRARKLALIALEYEVRVPAGLFTVGELEFDGAHVGRLLSIHEPKG